MLHKESLSVRGVKSSRVSECEIESFVKDNCIGYICVAYRSPVQSNIEF